LERQAEAPPALLAAHHERGADPARAAPHHARAASMALDRGDFAATVHAVERAIACGSPPPVVPRLRVLEAEAHLWSGDYERAAERAAEALSAAAAGTPAWYEAITTLVAAAGK